MPVLLKVKGVKAPVVAPKEVEVAKGMLSKPKGIEAPSSSLNSSKKPANKPIVRPLPNFSPSKSYVRKGPTTDENGRLRGGRGHKKELVLPFDPTNFPPVLNYKELSEADKAALDAAQDSSAAGFATAPATDLVYIGRDDHDPKGRGRFGNPFKIGAFHGDRDDVCDRHIKNTVVTVLFTRPGKERLKDIRETLGGKRLVCWCKPLRCHGDFLRLLANCPEDKLMEYLKLIERNLP